MSTKALVPLNVLAIGTEPAGQRAGDLYFNSGSAWIDISGVGSGGVQMDGGTPSSFYGGTPIVEGGYPSSTFTGSYDGGVS
jgi:hypothetical protein